MGSALSLPKFVDPKANCWTSVAGGPPIFKCPLSVSIFLEYFFTGWVQPHPVWDLGVRFSLDLERACVIGFPSIDRGLVRFPSLRFIGASNLTGIFQAEGGSGKRTSPSSCWLPCICSVSSSHTPGSSKNPCRATMGVPSIAHPAIPPDRLEWVARRRVWGRRGQKGIGTLARGLN